MWYRRREQPVRLGSWYAMNGVVNMVGPFCILNSLMRELIWALIVRQLDYIWAGAHQIFSI